MAPFSAFFGQIDVTFDGNVEEAAAAVTLLMRFPKTSATWHLPPDLEQSSRRRGPGFGFLELLQLESAVRQRLVTSDNGLDVAVGLAGSHVHIVVKLARGRGVAGNEMQVGHIEVDAGYFWNTLDGTFCHLEKCELHAAKEITWQGEPYFFVGE